MLSQELANGIRQTRRVHTPRDLVEVLSHLGQQSIRIGQSCVDLFALGLHLFCSQCQLLAFLGERPNGWVSSFELLDESYATYGAPLAMPFPTSEPWDRKLSSVSAECSGND